MWKEIISYYNHGPLVHDKMLQKPKAKANRQIIIPFTPGMIAGWRFISKIS